MEKEREGPRLSSPLFIFLSDLPLKGSASFFGGARLFRASASFLGGTSIAGSTYHRTAFAARSLALGAGSLSSTSIGSRAYRSTFHGSAFGARGLLCTSTRSFCSTSVGSGANGATSHRCALGARRLLGSTGFGRASIGCRADGSALHLRSATSLLGSTGFLRCFYCCFVNRSSFILSKCGVREHHAANEQHANCDKFIHSISSC